MINKQICFIYCLCFLSIFAQAQKLPAKDSLEITSIINDWNTAWSTKDFTLGAKGYSPDAKFVNAFGDLKNGKQEVEQLLKEVFALPFVMTGKSEPVAQRFQVLSPTIVAVQTVVERKGQKMPDGTPIEKRKTTHLRVFMKDSDGWKIKSHLISDARDKQAVKH